MEIAVAALIAGSTGYPPEGSTAADTPSSERMLAGGQEGSGQRKDSRTRHDRIARMLASGTRIHPRIGLSPRQKLSTAG